MYAAVRFFEIKNIIYAVEESDIKYFNAKCFSKKKIYKIKFNPGLKIISHSDIKKTVNVPKNLIGKWLDGLVAHVASK